MEENVALDSSKQAQFVKSIKGIKKLLKNKKNEKNQSAESNKEDQDHVKTGKIKKRRRKVHGLVYLSHIPHGFYEHQMTEYFKQFGVVTNARVIRSKRTGASKGHAFVEFRDPNVAQIVAETMNNYLMGKRLIKAQLIPPEKQRPFAKRKNWNSQNNPGNEYRQKMKKVHNSVKDEKGELNNARKLLSNLSKTRKKLRELDIDYDFFTPVDIPEPLLELLQIKKEEDNKSKEVKKEEPSEDVKKERTTQSNNKKEKPKKSSGVESKDEAATKQVKRVEIPTNKKSKKSKEKQKTAPSMTNLPVGTNVNVNVKSKVDNKSAKETKQGKSATGVLKEKCERKLNEKNTSQLQNRKEKKLKDAGVKPLQNFVKIPTESSDESDSSVNFDSDEYEKLINDESDVPSDSGSDITDEDLDEEVTSEEESDEDESAPPPKKSKATTSLQKNQPMQSKKQGKKQIVNKPIAKPMKSIPPTQLKPSKKPKFEKKGNKKTLNKVIKKKK